MRRLLGELLSDIMVANSDVWCLTGDLGFGVLDPVRSKAPDRFINSGAAEQLMLGTAVGLSHCGKIPVCYSITPFVVFRPYEYLRNYLDHELANVKLIGTGRDEDYGHLGFSHWATDAPRALSVFDNITQWHPETKEELQERFQNWLLTPGPAYLNVRR